ncbi:MAG: hypothetical protein ACFFCZ_23540 [Promethearchaeota archaeon]
MRVARSFRVSRCINSTGALAVAIVATALIKKTTKTSVIINPFVFMFFIPGNTI